MTRERPIIFTAKSVRAILAGRKTQTRRVVKRQPPEDCATIRVETFHPSRVNSRGEEVEGAEMFGAYSMDGEWGAKCPYGAPGDRLWVKETFAVNHGYRPILDAVVYRADGEDQLEDDEAGPNKWRSPLFMARAQSRLTLDVVSVRVERLQEISEADAEAEGIDYYTPGLAYSDPRRRMEVAWDWINGKRAGCAWADNPWVWVVTFKKAEK